MIARTCASVFEDSVLRDPIQRLVFFIIDQQYVCHGIEGESPKVIKGSCMGINASPDIANLVFAVEREEPFTLRAEAENRYGLTTYLRYMDDIFI